VSAVEILQVRVKNTARRGAARTLRVRRSLAGWSTSGSVRGFDANDVEQRDVGESAQATVAFVDDQDGVGAGDGGVGVIDADRLTARQAHDERFKGFGL